MKGYGNYKIEHYTTKNVSKSKKIYFWLFTVIVVYLFFELVSLAVLQILHVKSSSFGHPIDLYIYDEKLDYKYRPNYRGYFSSMHYKSIPININSLGFRDYEFEIKKAPNVNRVLLLGDSITFGSGVRMENTYAKQCEKLLRQSDTGPYQIINAGVNSYHFEHYYTFIEENLDIFNPDYLIIGFCINDIRPREVVSQRYLVQDTNKLPYSGSLKHYVKKLIKKSPTFQMISYLSFSNTYNRKKYSTMWITEVILSWKNNDLNKKLIKMLDDIKRITDERAIKLSLIIFPEMHQLLDSEKYGVPREKLLTILNDLNISYLDLYDTFHQKEDFSKYYLKGDTVHFTAEGHIIIAEELRKYILNNS